MDIGTLIGEELKGAVAKEVFKVTSELEHYIKTAFEVKAEKLNNQVRAILHSAIFNASCNLSERVLMEQNEDGEITIKVKLKKPV